ncbi:MAG: FtsX-like permease family protein [Gemmatimonadota bacterium]
MNQATSPRPPRLARWLLRSVLPTEARHLVAELDDLHAARAARSGRWAAHGWYLRQVAGFGVRIGPRRLLAAGTGPIFLGRDIRLALRTCRREPAYAAAFICTLALGVGGVATVYAAAHWVVLRPPPGVGAPADLVTLRLGADGAPPHVSFGVSEPDLVRLRERIPGLTGLAASTPRSVNVIGADGQPRRVAAELVTADYLDVLQVSTVAGRGFLPEEGDMAAPAAVLVLAYDLALELAGSAAGAVGRTVRVNDRPFQVVGVAPPGFRGAELPGRARLWFPPAALPAVAPATPPDVLSRGGAQFWQRLVGRRAAGVPVAAVAAAANAEVELAKAQGPYPTSLGNMVRFRFDVWGGVGLDPAVRAQASRTLALLAGAAAFLLLLVVANLASLVLARVSGRTTGTAVRLALGAGRGRVAREVLVETMVLGVLGAAGALLLAVAWRGWFEHARLGGGSASLEGMPIGVPVVAFALATAVVTGLLAGIPPALATRRAGLLAVLRGARHGDRAGQRVRSLLVAFQVAVSVVLLVGGGLLARTVANLRAVDLGFDGAGIATVTFDPEQYDVGPGGVAELARRVERHVMEQLPGARAGVVSPPPLQGGFVTHGVQSQEESARWVAGYYVTPGFVPTLGARVLAGTPAWRADSGTVVITRAVATALWPGSPAEAAVGRTVWEPDYMGGGTMRVAAVLEDIRSAAVTGEIPGALFRPLAEMSRGSEMQVWVRSADGPGRVAAEVRRALAAAAPGLPVYDVRSVRATAELQFMERTVLARAAGALAVLGLLLAAVGLYGVMASAVAERRREIGVRAALGAAPGEILGSVVARGLVLALVGGVAGIAAATVVGRALRAQLFGLHALDTATYVGGMVAVLLVAAAASWLPARRATRISPMEVLRNE